MEPLSTRLFRIDISGVSPTPADISTSGCFLSISCNRSTKTSPAGCDAWITSPTSLWSCRTFETKPGCSGASGWRVEAFFALHTDSIILWPWRIAQRVLSRLQVLELRDFRSYGDELARMIRWQRACPVAVLSSGLQIEGCHFLRFLDLSCDHAISPIRPIVSFLIQLCFTTDHQIRKLSVCYGPGGVDLRSKRITKDFFHGV